MKSRIIHLAVIGLSVGLLTTACNRQEKKTEDLQRIQDSMEHPKNVVDTLNADRHDWENWKIAAQGRIKQNQDSIEAFKKKLETANDKTKAKYKEKVAQAESYNAQLKKKIDEYKEEGRENWLKFEDDIKKELDTADLHMKVFGPGNK